MLWWASAITRALTGECDVCGGSSFVLCWEDCDVDVNGFFFLTVVSAWDYCCVLIMHLTLFLLFSLQIHITIKYITHGVSNMLDAVLYALLYQHLVLPRSQVCISLTDHWWGFLFVLCFVSVFICFVFCFGFFTVLGSSRVYFLIFSCFYPPYCILCHHY